MEETVIESEVEQPNSVEISVNAKGQFSGKVKVYSETIEDAFNKAIKKSEELEKFIKKKNF